MSSLDYLLNEINLNTSVVSDFLRTNGHPSPTFSPDTQVFFPEAPEHVQIARGALLSSLGELYRLVQYPYEAIGALVQDVGHTAALHLIIRFRVAEAVPIDKSISYRDLATKTGIPEQKLTRILRTTMLRQVFHEPEKGFVAHSSLSACIVKSPQARDILTLGVEGIFPPLAKVTDFVQQFGDDERADNSPCAMALGKIGDTSFEALNRAGLVDVMAKGMKATRADTRVSPEHIADSFAWAKIGKGTVVDVGGSHGQVSIAIARKHPALSFIVQDLPNEVEAARSSLPTDLTSRITFTPHDFFTPNPIKSADVYLLRMILHDWPDKTAISILQNIVCSMGPKSRILICDMVMPEPGTVERYEEMKMREVDMMMMTINGVERTLEMWKNLIESVGGGLRILEVRKPKGSMLSIIEVGMEE